MTNSSFYWDLGDSRGIPNLRGNNWAEPHGTVSHRNKNGEAIVNGASDLDGRTAWIDLGDLGPRCLTRPSTCPSGTTLSLWLRFYNKQNMSEQTFLATANASALEQGFRIYNNGKDDQLAIDVTKPNGKCTQVFVAPTGLWNHVLLTWQDVLTVYLNGGRVTRILHHWCDNVTYSEPRETKMTLGRDSYPLASYDELVIWDRVLSIDEINTLYTWYKGK